MVTLLLIAVALGTFTQLATYSPWSPVMNAWSGDPVPVEYLDGRSPLERQGVAGLSGEAVPQLPFDRRFRRQRGPALDSVATRITHDQLVRQVIQGGGNMPAYGKNLNPAEVTALVSFLETLHPPNQRARATQARRQRSCPFSVMPCSRTPAVLRSWSFPPVATLRNRAVGASLPARMVAPASRRRALPAAMESGRVSCPACLIVWMALASPIDVFNGCVLTAHMLQHMLLMMVAPPLILLGAPLVPMMRGLPGFAARELAGADLEAGPLAMQTARALTHPIMARC